MWGFLLVRLLLEPILWLESAELPPLDWEQQGFISLGIGAPTTLVALLGLGSSSFSVGDIAQFCFGDQTCSLFGLLLVMGDAGVHSFSVVPFEPPSRFRSRGGVMDY